MADEADPETKGQPLKVALVAGEASGDLLGAELMQAIRTRRPGARFFGIGGPRMQALGFESLFDMEQLAVMGLVEVVGRLPQLIRMRRELIAAIRSGAPDVFVGIDAPDFNLGLEERLRQGGIRTVHYVSPSVWAWRGYRVPRIGRSVDLMLTLFPFETAVYEAAGIPVRCVGHPLADRLSEVTDPAPARERLGLGVEQPCAALLPGSRMSEARRLGPVFLQTAAWCQQQLPGLQWLLPCATPVIRTFLAEVAAASGAEVKLLDGESHLAMQAADVVLTASGTATLEAMLVNRPMVVAYRLAPLTHWLAQRLVKVPYFSLPNLLAGEALVPELLQDDAVPERLGPAVLAWLQQPARRAELQQRFRKLREVLGRNASARAADAVLALADHS